jgi:type IV pilus assembly protein PilV
MLEVLVSILILTFGLLGVAGLQARAQVAEAESYQRAQAILLLQDMVDRINANRKNSMSYETAAPKGTGNAVQNCAALTGAALDLCEWNNALLGSSETLGGQSVGAMIGARGCVVNEVPAMPRRFLVSVVWQGLNPTVEPAVTACGQGAYPDKQRRAIVARVVIGCLQNDPKTGLCVTP